MPWTVLWWTGGLAGGVVALWVLASAAGLDRPRWWLRGGSGTLACGACGHEAVTPDRIATCPECGAEYARAGLLTPRAGLRYGPPLWVVALLLLALAVIGSALLAPMAGRAANRRAIGAAMVEEARITHSFEPPHGYALALHQEQARAQQMGAWSQSPPVLEGTVRLELVAGSAAGSGINHPSNRGLPKFSLELPGRGGSWRLLDSAGVAIDRGTGVDKGVTALYDAAGLGPASPTPAITEAELAGIAGLAAAFQGAQSGRPSGFAGLLPSTGLNVGGVGTAILGYHTFHWASPWGIAAGTGSGAGLSLVALLLLGAIAWSRRRMVRGAQAGRRARMAPRPTPRPQRSASLAPRTTPLAARPASLSPRTTSLAARSASFSSRTTSLSSRSASFSSRRSEVDVGVAEPAPPSGGPSGAIGPGTTRTPLADAGRCPGAPLRVGWPP